MGIPSNANHATTPETGPGVVLPANWWELASRSGMDPAERDMQIRHYGWKVGTHVAPVPPVELRTVDARAEVFTGTLLFGLGCVLAITFRKRGFGASSVTG